MTSWSEGYVHGVNYSYGYFSEMNPLNVEFSILSAGIVPPKIKTACELGIGQGISLNSHAAASTVRWFGNDFNPSQAAFAGEMAGASGAEVTVSDEAFADFCSRGDLPDFDFIALHGVWSWVSNENRNHILKLVSEKLNVGGVLYVSYNTLPGWSSLASMRHIMNEYIKIYGCAGAGVESNVDEAMAFFERLVSSDSAFLSAAPILRERFEQMKGKGREYLAHEYFNSDWEPMYFSQVAELLESVKLSFATSAHYPDTIARLNYAAEHDAVVDSVSDPRMRQTVIDCLVNRQFRRDYWIKGPRKVSAEKQLEAFSKIKILLNKKPEEIDLEIKTEALTAELSKGVYMRLADLLADFKVQTVGQLIMKAKEVGINYRQVVQSIGVFQAKGDLSFVGEGYDCQKVKDQVDGLNDYLFTRAVSNDLVPMAVSPYSGTAITLHRLELMFAKFIKMGATSAEQIASSVAEILWKQGSRITFNGKLLESKQENEKFVLDATVRFFEEHAPMLKAHGII